MLEPWVFLMPMPIYEFYCPDNHRIYGFYARTQALAGRVPRCPDNPAFRMVKVPSRFAVTGRHRDKPGAEGGADAGDDPFSRLDDAQMEKLMGEFEGDMGGDQEPDLERPPALVVLPGGGVLQCGRRDPERGAQLRVPLQGPVALLKA